MARVSLWAGEVGPLVPGPVLQVVGLPAPVSHTRGKELGATCHMGHSDRAAWHVTCLVSCYLVQEHAPGMGQLQQREHEAHQHLVPAPTLLPRQRRGICFNNPCFHSISPDTGHCRRGSPVFMRRSKEKVTQTQGLGPRQGTPCGILLSSKCF